jgi:hypothetical protein
LENVSQPKYESKQAEGREQIMISYARLDQAIAIKLADRLRIAGFNIWIDLQKRSGSRLESMANAVENSKLIIILVSSIYKKSAGCRIEGEYIHSLHKNFIPVVVEDGYHADGWLGAMLGTKLYYKLLDDNNFERNVQSILRAVSSAVDTQKNPVCKELYSLFTKLGIEKYLTVFEKDGNDFKDLKGLSIEDLKELVHGLWKGIASEHRLVPDCISFQSTKECKELFTPDFLRKLSSQCKVDKISEEAIKMMVSQKKYILEILAGPKHDPNSSYDAFLSHVQKDSKDLCRSLYYATKEMKALVWYDKVAERLDLKGMVDGVNRSNEFVLVMTRTYFTRPYCVYEFLVAIALGKPITVLLEVDKNSHGGLTFDELKKEVPELYLPYVTSHEVISINRDLFAGFVAKFVKRILRHRKKACE